MTTNYPAARQNQSPSIDALLCLASLTFIGGGTIASDPQTQSEIAIASQLRVDSLLDRLRTGQTQFIEDARIQDLGIENSNALNPDLNSFTIYTAITANRVTHWLPLISSVYSDAPSDPFNPDAPDNNPEQKYDQTQAATSNHFNLAEISKVEARINELVASDPDAKIEFYVRCIDTQLENKLRVYDSTNASYYVPLQSSETDSSHVILDEISERDFIEALVKSTLPQVYDEHFEPECERRSFILRSVIGSRARKKFNQFEKQLTADLSVAFQIELNRGNFPFPELAEKDLDLYKSTYLASAAEIKTRSGWTIGLPMMLDPDYPDIDIRSYGINIVATDDTIPIYKDHFELVGIEHLIYEEIQALVNFQELAEILSFNRERIAKMHLNQGEDVAEQYTQSLIDIIDFKYGKEARSVAVNFFYK